MVMPHLFFLLFLAGSFSCIIVYAEGEQAPEAEEWNPSSAGPVITWTAPLCEKGKFVIQPFSFYNHTRGLFKSDGHYYSLAEGSYKYQWQEQLFVQYGVTDKLEIDGQTVYQENYVKEGELKAHSNGFGDSYLFLRYCPIEENGWLPHVNGLFQLKIPTGKYQHADSNKLGTDLMGATSGAGSWDQGLGLILTKKLKPFILHTDIIYTFPQQVKIDGIKTKYSNYLNYDFGIEYFLPKGFNLMLECNGLVQGDKKQDGEKINNSDVKSISMSPGIGWSNKTVQLLLAYQRTLVGTNVDANDSAVITAVFTF